MIGDRERDMLGAVHNEVYPVVVVWGYGSMRSYAARVRSDCWLHR
ncbi:MAG: hypothetical protein ABW106_12480 [Steroidobacteraceae bacterium]